MPLKTVRVPPEIEARFAEAEQLVSRYFRDRRDDPEHGTIEIFGERYVLVRAASLSVEFFGLVQDLYGPGREREADDFAQNILFDLAHAIGKSDAHNFHSKMGLSDPIARLSAGPIHFSHTGWAFVDISPESRPTPDRDFYLLYDHPYSFESDAWVRASRRRESPACIMNAGYSSGWCEESFGVTLVSAEVLCRAKGDDVCRFIMAHPDKVEAAVERYIAKGREGRGSSAPSYVIPDFFARKRVEEELREARAELERRVEGRTAELKTSNDLLRREIDERQEVEMKLLQAQKLEAVGRLAGGIAHDFNNLMAVIIGNAGLLTNRLPHGDPLRAFVEEIDGAGRRAATLTHQLLSFSRANVLAREILDLNQIVQDLSRMLSRVIGEDIELVTKLTPELGLIEADRGQIEQVVMNLVVNARDAMSGASAASGVRTLRLETSRVDLEGERSSVHGPLPAGRYVVLSVADTGVGMDDDVLSRIFDPFYTTKSSAGEVAPATSGMSGTGLGLSTVYGIIKQAGGGITVTSAPERGSRFTVYLPHVELPNDRRVQTPRLDPVLRGDETLLVVEDQGPLRRALALALRDLGYAVLEAADGAEALARTEQHRGTIHLMVTDVIMPRMRGPELAQRVRETRPDIRVLYVSGYTDDPSLVIGAHETRVALLPKPFAPDALGRKVRELLDA